MHKRTRIAVCALIVSAFASIAVVAAQFLVTGLPLRAWPVDSLILIASLVATPVALAVVWWPRRYAVDQALAKRPDSEHEQATIRMALGGVAMLYLSLASLYIESHQGLELAATAMAWGLCVGWLALLHIVLSPAQSTPRRGAMAMVDLLTLSYMLAVGGGPASVLFPIYLWVTFGNGFRYGVSFLVFSAMISTLGFGGAVLTSSYWSSNNFVASGLLISLIVLPAYVSTLIKKLNRARAQAEEASQAKSRFLATMSHELRTPLTAVISTGDLLETTSLDADQRSMIGTVQTSAKTLLSLINEILDLSRIEAGKQNLDLGDIDVCEVVASVWRMLHTQAEQKGLQLRVSLDARLQVRLVGDSKRLTQILVNLVGNAIKFTTEGEVEISARLTEHKGRQDIVLLSVRDTGIGVAPEKLGSIFDGFTQADDAINRRYGGTGLGLTITKQLVEMMGGEIEVLSQEGQGSQFNLSIPFDLGEPAEIAAAKVDATENAAADATSGVTAESQTSGILPVIVCIAEPHRGRIAAVLQGPEVKTVDRIDEAIPAIEGYRGMGHLLIVVGSDEHDELSGPLMGYLADRGANDGIAIVEVSAEGGAVSSERRWPVDVVISAPAETGAFSTALHQAGLFCMSGVSRGAADEAETGDAAVPDAARRKILLVDDNRTNRSVISRVLENAGHVVETAEDGDDALDRLDAEAFDIVLTDINMPGTSGLDLTKMYRVLNTGEPHMPIVALTADATEQAKQDCREAGMDGYLTKPVEAQQLLALVRELTLDVAAAGGDRFDAGAAPAHDPLPERPAQLITPISAHPKYGGASNETVLDPDALDALRALDTDEAFVAEIFDGFLVDAAATMVNLNQAFDNGDLAAFHDEAHALRSSAGYVGAKRMVRLLLDMRECGPDRDNDRTRALLAELNSEFDMVRAAVGRELAQDRRATPN
ncbi:response regulator [Denitrobaculum tricleocarpae]|uniref:response regulator n=1 Tax=Denitrobaculum tricleocarpae TaxID=2591009 RepID=UPI0015D0EBCC|nr:response regulator [Denitrobaculum tricleocarpae]